MSNQQLCEIYRNVKTFEYELHKSHDKLLAALIKFSTNIKKKDFDSNREVLCVPARSFSGSIQT